MKKITLQMIADQLEVSKALVSKALSNDPSVNDRTREAIWKKAEELGYRIKPPARKALPGTRTGNIAVLMPRAYLCEMEYWGRIITGIDRELEHNGYSMMLSGLDIALPPEEGLPTSVYENKADGAIVLGHLPETYTDVFRERGFPFVLADANRLQPAIDHVMANNFMGAYEAVGKLLAAGHRKLAFVGDAATSWSFLERERGFATAIEQYAEDVGRRATYVRISGIGVSGEGMYVLPALAEGLRAHVVDEREEPVTALFGANDLCAVEALKRLNEWNVTCPDDISVIGFDNLSLTGLMTPHLTTVSVPKEAIGARAVQLILRRLDRPDTVPELVLLSTALIERDSVKPPASGRTGHFLA